MILNYKYGQLDAGEWAMELTASHTNHNHEELVENIAEFAIRGYRR